MGQRTKEEMYPLLEKWFSSNESKGVFCKSHRINPHTLYYWEQKYKKEKEGEEFSSEEGEFLNLAVEAEADGLELIYPNGVRLKFSNLVSSSYLSTLVNLSV